MSKILYLCLLCVCFCVRVCAYNPVCGVLVANADTGSIVYSYNADAHTQPASLTKMMTLKLVFREIKKGRLKPTDNIKISKYSAAQSPSKLGLKAGECISVRNAILALITKSANDIAVALAEHVGGNVSHFVDMMNKEASRIGMKSTKFVNPSGWKNTAQYTTARDMYILSRSLLKEYPDFYHLFSKKSFRYNNMRMANHNNLLGQHPFPNKKSKKYFVVDGIKTGYVCASGFNLAASATDGKIRLIAVVLGGKTAKQRDSHVNLLFEKGFPRAYLQLANSPKKKTKMFNSYEEKTSRLAYVKQVGVWRQSINYKPQASIQKAKHNVKNKKNLKRLKIRNLKQNNHKRR